MIPPAEALSDDQSRLGPRRSAFGTGFVYAAALISQRALGFLLLPLYTRYLTPEQYGVLSIAIAVGLAASFLLSFGLESAVLHHWFRLANQPDERRRWVGAVATFMIVAPLVGTATIGLVVLAVPGPLLGLDDSELALAILGGTTWAMLNVIPFALLRAQERLREYLILTAVLAVSNSLATIIFVVFVDGGVAGWLLGTLLANLATLGVSLRLLPWPTPTPRALRSTAMVGALAFGLPLLPHLISQWALQVVDRLVLEGLVSLDRLGVYSLAANLTAPILIVASGLAQGSTATYARAHDGAPGSMAEVSDLVTKQIATFAIVGLAGALLLPTAIDTFLPSSYHDAAALCPLLALSFTLAGLYYIPMNIISLTLGRTRWVWLATLTGSAANVAFIYALVPSHGINGAVFATLIGYGVLLVSIVLYARHLVQGRIQLSVRTLSLVSTVVAAAFLAAMSTQIDSNGFEIVARVCLLGAAGFLTGRIVTAGSE